MNRAVARFTSSAPTGATCGRIAGEWAGKASLSEYAVALRQDRLCHGDGAGTMTVERQAGDWRSQVLAAVVRAARDGLDRVLVRRILWQAEGVQFIW